MKTIIISYWHGKKYDELPYKHNEKIPYSTETRTDIISNIINAGYSAMIRPFDSDNELLIWIDKGRFGQK